MVFARKCTLLNVVSQIHKQFDGLLMHICLVGEGLISRPNTYNPARTAHYGKSRKMSHFRHQMTLDQRENFSNWFSTPNVAIRDKWGPFFIFFKAVRVCHERPRVRKERGPFSKGPNLGWVFLLSRFSRCSSFFKCCCCFATFLCALGWFSK